MAPESTLSPADVATRQLTLLRHAQAESHTGPGADFDRALSLVGRRQCHVVANRLLEHGVLPQVVLCSAATRARQTWKLIASALGEAADDIDVRYLEDLYGADAGEVIELVRGLDDDVSSVLVVGHEPVMSAVAHKLAGPHSQESAALRVRTGISTATLAFLEVHSPWTALKPRAARLTGLATTPKD